jgi:DHA3 family tetracycline resistance protein-like MFS transporter
MFSSVATPARLRARIGSSVLGVRDFRWLWSAQTVSTIGDQVFPIAATVSVLNAGGSVGDLGLVLGARWLAIVTFALVGGVWADRLPRRLVMMAADIFRAAAIGALALLPFTPSVWLLAALVFLVGSGEAFFRPAETALLPSLLPKSRLNSANALISISYRTAAVVGPGVGGLLVAGFHQVRWAYAVNAITFLISFAFLLRVREPARAAASTTPSFVAEVRDGLAEVRRQPWVLGTLVAGALVLMAVIAPENVLLPVIGRREFGTDAVFAIAMALFSLGGVGGAFLAVRWKPSQPGRVAWLLGLSFGTIPLALMFPVSPWPIFAAYLITGACWEPFAVWWMSALQREIPSDKLARVSSVDWMASFGLMPLGLALTGPIVAAVGESTVLLGSILLLVMITFAVLRVPGVAELRTPRQLATTPPAPARGVLTER